MDRYSVTFLQKCITLRPLIVVPPLTPKFDKNYHPFPFINIPLNRKISFEYEYEI